MSHEIRTPIERRHWHDRLVARHPNSCRSNAEFAETMIRNKRRNADDAA